MSNELGTLLDEYVESEIKCSRNRQIYSELEQIFMKKQFSDRVESATAHLENLSLRNATLSTSLIKKNSSSLKLTKSRSSISDKTGESKKRQWSTPDKNCFVPLKKSILQFESYQKMLKQPPNKNAVDFLKLLEAQNSELTANFSKNQSDS